MRDRAGGEVVRETLEEASARFAAHPAEGLGADTAAVARLADGLVCRVSGPDGDVTTDVATGAGGGGSAPTPGWLLRAALASCNASVVAMEAARAGIVLTELTVSVESESDARGMLGAGESVAPGPISVSVRFELSAENADATRLRELVALAEERSAVRDAIAREIEMTTDVVVGP